MLEDRNIDIDKFLQLPVATVQQFRTQAMKILDDYLADSNRQPMLMMLDSLGQLSTTKEVTDIAAGSETKDMTRAALIKGAFRVLDARLGAAQVAMIITNHTYDEQGSMYPQKIMSGGSGLKYAADGIYFFSKSKARDSNKDIIGAIISIVTNKSRMSVENKRTQVLLDHKKGLNRYYGLLDLAEKYGIITKDSTRYAFPNGKKAFESVIYKNPEEWFTKDVLDLIDSVCETEFGYGGGEAAAEVEEA